MKHQIYIFLCLSVFITSCKPQPQNKNILFILVDDFGYNDISYRDNSFYETPNIDKLAHESMVFNEGYASCQVCSPSRASILTGKSPARHGITDWLEAPSSKAWREQGHNDKLLPAAYKLSLPLEYTTLPEVLKEKGYNTFFAGKWHLGGQGSLPEDHGFDINIGGGHSGYPVGGYFSPFKNSKLSDGKKGENLSMRLANETVNFIKQNKDKPFFAFLSFYAVHGPIETSKEKWKKYRDKAEHQGIEEQGYKMGKYLPIRQTQDNPIYGGLVESMDAAVGHVLNQLKEFGLDENTIVIFTSDNGGVSSGDSYSTSNLPLREGKGSQYEGGIKEPYFIKVPWLNNENKQSNIPVIGTDFYPTILELIDSELKPEEHQDGVSLLPILNGQTIPDRPLIWHYPHYGNQGGQPASIIRKGNWKLIYFYEDENVELYNLKNDVGELTDLSQSNPTLVSELKVELFEYLNKVGAKFPQKDSLYDPSLKQQEIKEISSSFMLKLEQQRNKELSPDFVPNKDWWGSYQTKD